MDVQGGTLRVLTVVPVRSGTWEWNHDKIVKSPESLNFPFPLILSVFLFASLNMYFVIAYSQSSF